MQIYSILMKLCTKARKRLRNKLFFWKCKLLGCPSDQSQQQNLWKCIFRHFKYIYSSFTDRETSRHDDRLLSKATRTSHDAHQELVWLQEAQHTQKVSAPLFLFSSLITLGCIKTRQLNSKSYVNTYLCRESSRRA